jgi:hypothetical protein
VVPWLLWVVPTPCPVLLWSWVPNRVPLSSDCGVFTVAACWTLWVSGCWPACAVDFASNGVAATGETDAAALEAAVTGELPAEAALLAALLKLAFWKDGPLAPEPALPNDGPLPDGALNDGPLPDAALKDGPLPNEGPLPKDAAGDTVEEKPPAAGPCCW